MKLFTHTSIKNLHDKNENEKRKENKKMTRHKKIITFHLFYLECPPATDGMERFACPTPDRQGRYRCIDDHVLCDGFIDCPEGKSNSFRKLGCSI